MLTLPEMLVHEHARLVLTTALYLVHPVTYSTQEQLESRHQQVRQLMARVETALRRTDGEIDRESSPTQADAGAVSLPEDRDARAAEEALLHRRLRLLRAGMALYEMIAASAYERLPALQQEMQELDQDEEVIWHMLPLFCSVILYSAVRQEGAKLLPQLLDARQRVRQSGSRFAAIKVMQWLALSALAAGQLRLATQESQAALDLIEQMKDFAVLKGFQIILAEVRYQWNHLEEARRMLRTVVQDAATWKQSNVLLSGYLRLTHVELARGDLSAVQQVLYEFEQLEGYHRWRWLAIMRAQWWLAQGHLNEAAEWAASTVFPEGAWERSLYDAFPVVIRVYFAQRRFPEALELLERWSAQLDRPGRIDIAITYLAQLLVALHWAGRREQAREIAARLFALTEPEGYLRVYLDEGEPMREALLAWLSPPSQPDELAAFSATYVSDLLAAFDVVPQGASQSQDAAPPSRLAPSLMQQAPAISAPPGASLTRREQDVLRLLAAGASNQEIARTLVIGLPTVKKHVSNLLGKLGASSRTQAISRARALSLL
jgi:LuxR family maltose regulon positive regulatory protein